MSNVRDMVDAIEQRKYDIAQNLMKSDTEDDSHGL